MEQPGRRKRERPQTRYTDIGKEVFVEQPLKAAFERRRSRRRTTKKEKRT